MITGIGFTEILAVLMLVLLFFGSKEIPRFIREGARLWGKIRGYGDKFRRELNELSKEIDTGAAALTLVNESAEKKKALRARFLAIRRGLSADERREKSIRIVSHFLELPELENALSVMIYLSTGSEVETDLLAVRLREMKKRMVIPYCRPSLRNLGIAEISDVGSQTDAGTYRLREPLKEFRDNILKSDIRVVVCPGVAFDHYGGRLGRGKGYYDNFLRELQGRSFIVGLGFACQVSAERFPFAYSDVPMNQIITENGPLVRNSDI